MKFTEDQKDLLALLPKELKNSNELTDSSKLVLSNIIFLYGMEDAQKNGYVYRTNSKMMEETNIKSEHTLIGAVRLLELLGYIETTRGKRKEASTYKLLIDCSKKCSKKCSNKNSQNNEIEILQKQVALLQKEIEELKKCTEKCTDKCTDKNEKCSKKCSTDTESDTETIKPVEQGPVVIKTIKENKKPVEQIPVVIKEKKENEMNERSECNEMNATNGMSVVNGMNENEVKRNDAISSTSGDKSQSSVINNNSLRERSVNAEETQKENGMNDVGMNEMNANNGMNVVNGMTNEVKRNDCISSTTGNNPKVRPSSTETSNKAACDVQTPKMEQLPTEVEKVQQDAKEMPQTEREAKIASIMSNIEINKDVMLKAKSQMQFDAHFQDFKRNMSNLKHLVSEDAYQDYRSTQGKWWKATVKYLIWYKDPNKKPTKPTKPTVEQMGNYQYHLDSMRIAQKIEDLENALNRMENWFEKMEALYTKTVMEQYWQKFERDCASVKRSNPIFEEWQKKMSQTIQ